MNVEIRIDDEPIRRVFEIVYEVTPAGLRVAPFQCLYVPATDWRWDRPPPAASPWSPPNAAAHAFVHGAPTSRPDAPPTGEQPPRGLIQPAIMGQALGREGGEVMHRRLNIPATCYVKGIAEPRPRVRAAPQTSAPGDASTSRARDPLESESNE